MGCKTACLRQIETHLIAVAWMLEPEIVHSFHMKDGSWIVVDMLEHVHSDRGAFSLLALYKQKHTNNPVTLVYKVMYINIAILTY